MKNNNLGYFMVALYAFLTLSNVVCAFFLPMGEINWLNFGVVIFMIVWAKWVINWNAFFKS